MFPWDAQFFYLFSWVIFSPNLPPQILYRVNHCNDYNLRQSAWYLRVGAFHWREHWTWNPVSGETWTSGPNSMANQLCDLQGSITMIHQHVFIILFPYRVLGIISTAFSALHTLSLIPQQPWCLLINLHPVTSLSGPKLPDTCQEPHTSKHTLTDTHTDSVSCIPGSSAAPTVSLIFQFSGVCIHLGAAFELFHSSSWSQADLSSFPIHPEEGRGLFSSEYEMSKRGIRSRDKQSFLLV